MIKNGDKIQLGPFVGIVELTTRDERTRNWPDWLNIYYESETSEQIAYKSFFANRETPLQALSSWLKVDSILDSMHFHKLIKDFSIYY